MLLWIVNSTFILFASNFKLFYTSITDFTFSDYEDNAATCSEVKWKANVKSTALFSSLLFLFSIFELRPCEIQHQKVPGKVYVSTDCSFCGWNYFLKTNIVQMSDFASNFGTNVFSWTNFVVLMSQAERDGPVPMKLATVFLLSFWVIDALLPLHPPLMTGTPLFILNEPRELHQLWLMWEENLQE